MVSLKKCDNSVPSRRCRHPFPLLTCFYSPCTLARLLILKEVPGKVHPHTAACWPLQVPIATNPYPMTASLHLAALAVHKMPGTEFLCTPFTPGSLRIWSAHPQPESDNHLLDPPGANCYMSNDCIFGTLAVKAGTNPADPSLMGQFAGEWGGVGWQLAFSTPRSWASSQV